MPDRRPASIRQPRHAPRVVCALGLAVAACGGAGPYGYSKTYSPLDAEESAAEGSETYDPVMATRSPQKWKGKSLSLFGVVTARKEGPGGTTDVTLSVRTLEPRNLCDTADQETCRVTVSERSHAVVHAHLELRPDDVVGEKSVGAGSLVRVIGTLADDAAGDGQHTLHARYYRHWPRNHFVTTAARSYMRR